MTQVSLYCTVMGIQDQGRKLLKETEAAIQRLVGEAATEGDYDAVLQLATWAKRLALFASEPDVSHPNTTLSAPTMTASGLTAKRDARAKRAKPTTKAKRKTSSREGSQYPKFHRRADHLVKVGWSKREKQEYQHKASRSVLQRVIAAILKVALETRQFTSQGFLPVKDADGAECPEYQAYLCLAWLRHEGLIVQHGRQGYSIPDPATLENAISDRWSQLELK